MCGNTQFMCNALTKSIAIENDDIGKIIESLVCDTKRKGCMFGDCSKCNTNRLEYNSEKRNDEINWCEWTLRNEKILIGKKGEEKNITLTVKETREGTVSDLVDTFEGQLVRYKKQLFSIRAQYSYYITKRQSLGDNECMIYIDFSENYEYKMSSEIQGMHFGASKSNYLYILASISPNIISSHSAQCLKT